MEEFYEQILKMAGLEDTPDNRLEVDAALDYANHYCKTSFTLEDAPAGFKKAIAVLLQSAEQTPNVQSESVAGEMSVTYSNEANATAKSYLKPYRRAVFL